MRPNSLFSTLAKHAKTVVVLTSVGAVGVATAGCTSSQKPTAQNIAQHAPPPPHVTPGQTAAPEQVTEEAKANFADVVGKWNGLEKKNQWTDSDCNDAAGWWSDLADDNPTLVEARYNEGVAYEKCNMLDKAEQAYQAAVQVNPSYAPALANLGEMYWAGGKADLGEQYLRQAQTADPTNVTARDDLAQMDVDKYVAATDPGQKAQLIQEAKDDLQAALAVDANNMDAYTTLAEIFYYTAGADESKLNIAELVCDQAAAINANWAPIHNIEGLIQLQRKNVSAALARFKDAVGIDPNYIEANMNIGEITLNARDYTTAEGAFKTVIAQQPQNFDALVGLGVAYRGEGKIDDAEKQYLAAQKVDGNNPASYFNLALLYQDYRQSTADQLKKSKDLFTQYLSYDQGRDSVNEAEAKRRMDIIDQTLAALAQAAAQQQQMQQTPASKP
jgi:tetratricopeptide (TPR) repeat protein